MAAQVDVQRQLAEGLAKMDLELAPAQLQLLTDYLVLLNKWNKAYNLTAVRRIDDMVSRHLLDSLAILPYVDAEALLDVGSGAGLPGIPLAIARPDMDVTLLDSNSKKTRFLKQAVLELRLPNVQVVQERVEHYRPERKFPLIVSRAFASLVDMVSGTEHLLAPGGRWLAMKGRIPEDEIGLLDKAHNVGINTLYVPGEAGERHLLIID